MRDSKFTKVSEILPAILKKIGLARKLEEREILALWDEVVGEEIAARTQAVKCVHGVLYIYVTHGAWMQELHFMEPEILRKLAEKMPGANIQKIRFSSIKQH